MGTVFSIEAYGTNSELIAAAEDAALNEGHRLDQMLSNYLPDSEISRINVHASERPVKVTPELFNLLSRCVSYSRASEGTFDITVGPLMKTWGFFKDSGHLPTHAQIAAALEHVGYRNIQLDPQELTVRFSHPGMELDLGGVGKGYAVDCMKAFLVRPQVRAALITAGGSSIYGIGAPPGQPKGWRIRIRDPKEEAKTAADVYLKDLSLSTSGSYEKFFWAAGRIYSHIMDPRTGYPSQGMLSVSVLSPLTLDSEIWAKPYYILGRAWTATHKAREFRVLLCEDHPGAACSWLR
jgi:thiamine biosynthesis lipoprotein